MQVLKEVEVPKDIKDTPVLTLEVLKVLKVSKAPNQQVEQVLRDM